MTKEKKEILILRAISIVLLVIFVSGVIKSKMQSKVSRSEIKKELMLTAEEDLALKDVFKKYKKMHQDVRESRKKADEALNKSLADKDVDKEELQRLFYEREALRKKGEEQRFQMSLDIREVVGPDRMKTINKFRVLRRHKGKRSSGKKRHD